jgi:DNA-binding transcriptional LysR family regulator
MPQILSLFTRNYPQIDLKIQINSTPIIINKILKRKIDIAVIGGEIPNKLRTNLISRYLVTDEINLIISPIHPFARKKRINKEDLYYLNFITLNSNSTIQKSIDNILIQNQIETKKLNIIMQLNSLEGIKTAVSLGLGAAFLSSLAIEKELNLKTIEILKIKDIKITRSLSVISNSKHYKSKAFEFFYNELYILKNIYNY